MNSKAKKYLTGFGASLILAALAFLGFRYQQSALHVRLEKEDQQIQSLHQDMLTSTKKRTDFLLREFPVPRVKPTTIKDALTQMRALDLLSQESLDLHERLQSMISSYFAGQIRSHLAAADSVRRQTLGGWLAQMERVDRDVEDARKKYSQAVLERRREIMASRLLIEGDRQSELLIRWPVFRADEDLLVASPGT